MNLSIIEIEEANIKLSLAITAFNSLVDDLDLTLNCAGDTAKSNFRYRHGELANMASITIDYLLQASERLESVTSQQVPTVTHPKATTDK